MSEPIPMAAPLGDIAQRFQTISDDKFLAALAMLEVIHDTPEATALLSQVRPRLRQLRPNRPVAIRRLLCVPFEDLLHHGSANRPGRVARREIEPLWRLLTADQGAAIKSLQREFAGMSRTEPERVLDLGLRLWRLAGQSLRDRLADAIPSLEIIRSTLDAAREIDAFKRALPAVPLGALDGPALDLVVRATDALLKDGRTPEGYLLVIAARMASAETLVKALQEANAAIPVAVVRTIDALAIDDLTYRAADLARSWEELGPNALARELDALMRTMAGTRQAIGAEARVILQHQTAAATAALKTALQARVLDGAEPEIAAALAAPERAAEWRRAEERARALRHARRAARELGLGDLAEATVARIGHRIGAGLEASIDRIERSGGSADPLYRTIRLLELVAGSAAAGPLLSRVIRLADRPRG
jgi:hypothetical protein